MLLTDNYVFHYKLPPRHLYQQLPDEDDDEDNTLSIFGPSKHEIAIQEYLKTMLPLYHAASTLTDGGCVEFLETSYTNNDTK